MARISDAESDEELRDRVQALVFAHLCQRYNEDDAVVALEDLGERFSEIFPDNPDENMVELFRNSNLVDITEKNEFRLTAEGIAECITRRKASAS